MTISSTYLFADLRGDYLSASRATSGATLNAKSFGAIGDGVTDDTAAIRRAIAAAAASGGDVFLPPGTFISQPLTLPPGVVLHGVSGQTYYNATPTVPNVNNLSRLKLKAGSTGALISPDDSGANLATAVRVFDLALDCNGINQPAINLPDSGLSISRFWTIERVYVVNVNSANTASGYAVYIGNQNTACTMRDCVIFNGTSGSPAGYNGVGWYGSDGLMDNCYIGYFGNSGLVTIGGASDITFAIRGGGVFTCTTGIVVGAAGVVIDGVSVDHNKNDGIYVGAGPTSITNCTFHSNSTQTTNVWSHVKIDAQNVQVSMFGNRAAPRDADAGSNNPAYFINVNQTGVVLNKKGNVVESGVVFGTAVTNYTGATTTPTFPTSTTVVVNTTGADVTAYIVNGTAPITVIAIGGITTGLTLAASATGAIFIPAGQKVAFTYASGAPAWVWIIG